MGKGPLWKALEGRRAVGLLSLWAARQPLRSAGLTRVALCSPPSGSHGASGRVLRLPGQCPLHTCEPLARDPQPRFQCWPSSGLFLSLPSLPPREAGPWPAMHGARLKPGHAPPPSLCPVPSLRVTGPAQGRGSVMPGLHHPHTGSRARQDPHPLHKDVPVTCPVCTGTMCAPATAQPPWAGPAAASSFSPGSRCGRPRR